MTALYLLALATQPNLSAEASRDVARQHCVPADNEEILVCGSRRPDEKFRMPDRNGPFDPAKDMPSVMRERISWTEEGDSGTQSCVPVGPGSWTGCAVKAWKRERDQTQWKKNIPKR